MKILIRIFVFILYCGQFSHVAAQLNQNNDTLKTKQILVELTDGTDLFGTVVSENDSVLVLMSLHGYSCEIHLNQIKP